MSNLAHLETFDPKAFEGDAQHPQEVCNVVLGIALIYNDIKDTIAVINALHAVIPKGNMHISSEWGECAGRDLHILRHHVAMIWELFRFLEENIKAIQSAEFQSIIKLMSPKSRKAWEELVNAALDPNPTGTIGKILLRIRNKMAFHYDSGEIYRGFRSHFVDGRGTTNVQAFISRGSNMEESRFYFADAAMQGYIYLLLGSMKKEEFQKEIVKFVTSANKAFIELVCKFINKRGYSYQEYRSA